MKNLRFTYVIFFSFALVLTTKGEPKDEHADHWSFQVPVQQQVPAVKFQAWPRTSIDNFILARLESKGIQPNTDAEPQILLRRVFFDLIGLPPTLDEINYWVPRLRNDTDKGLTGLVDHLLNSFALVQTKG